MYSKSYKEKRAKRAEIMVTSLEPRMCRESSWWKSQWSDTKLQKLPSLLYNSSNYTQCQPIKLDIPKSLYRYVPIDQIQYFKNQKPNTYLFAALQSNRTRGRRRSDELTNQIVGVVRSTWNQMLPKFETMLFRTRRIYQYWDHWNFVPM